VSEHTVSFVTDLKMVHRVCVIDFLKSCIELLGTWGVDGSSAGSDGVQSQRITMAVGIQTLLLWHYYRSRIDSIRVEMQLKGILHFFLFFFFFCWFFFYLFFLFFLKNISNRTVSGLIDFYGIFFFLLWKSMRPETETVWLLIFF